MQFPRFVLALVCWAAAQTAASARVAVLLTDSKMDDKAAVAVTLLKRDAQNPAKPQYDRVVLVFTGASDRNKIASGMVDYLARAERRTPPVPKDWRDRTGWLQARTNVMVEEVPHERWYKNLKPKWTLDVATGPSLAASVAKAGSGGDPPLVDVFQIAPYEDKDVWEFIDALPNINIYHLFYGYNSRQGTASDKLSAEDRKALAQRQADFHATLQGRLKAKHAQARLIFTQNPISFSDPKAGSQELAWCRQYFPKEDITMALSDPFWTRLIEEANTYADAAVRLQNVPKDEDDFLRQVVGARLEDGPLRKQILAMLESAARSETFKKESSRSHGRVSNILVNEFTGTPSPTLELGDANHITAVLEYLDGEAAKSGDAAGKLLPAVCDKTEQNPTLPPKVDTGGPTAATEGWVLTGCDIKQTRADIERLFG
ncbi:hypothetical protein C8034_v004064 [Colletotrichum sidae]|uniref:Uncharacterized protein n=1 Tax=Colletotrichum sidae TaxID=1347389 RepID=A0A4R8T9H7_9PEZI|nr:hypothetical protein C8034_v004064 [Colletotrichum sidae]